MKTSSLEEAVSSSSKMSPLVRSLNQYVQVLDYHEAGVPTKRPVINYNAVPWESHAPLLPARNPLKVKEWLWLYAAQTHQIPDMESQVTIHTPKKEHPNDTAEQPRF